MAFRNRAYFPNDPAGQSMSSCTPATLYPSRLISATSCSPALASRGAKEGSGGPGVSSRNTIQYSRAAGIASGTLPDTRVSKFGVGHVRSRRIEPACTYNTSTGPLSARIRSLLPCQNQKPWVQLPGGGCTGCREQEE